MSKYRKLDKDEPLQIGDIVMTDHPLGGKGKYTISRLTARFAFARVRDNYETKYPSKFETYFQQLPRDKWNRTDYTVYRQVE